MKKLKLFVAACAAMVGLQVNAYTTSDLTSAGWSLVTDLSSVTLADNYFIFVDAGTSNYTVTNARPGTNGKPTYQAIQNPATDCGQVWKLSNDESAYYIQSLVDDWYFIGASNAGQGWTDLMATSSTNGNFAIEALGDNKYSIKSIFANGFVGPWNNDGAVNLTQKLHWDALDDNYYEELACNKNDAQSPDFYIYTITRSAYNATRRNSATLEAEGWSKVTTTEGLGQPGYYYTFLDLSETGYETGLAMVGTNGRPQYTSMAEPLANTTQLWTTEAHGAGYALKNIGIDKYFYLGSNATWNTGFTSDINAAYTDFVANVSDGKWTLSNSLNTSEFVGRWSNSPYTPGMDENIAANKAADAGKRQFLIYSIPTIAGVAIALPANGEMVANTWYYFDIAVTGNDYKATSTALSDIVYTADGTTVLTPSASFTNQFTPTDNSLTVGRYYVKSTSANNLVVEAANYTYTVGSASANVSYTQSGNTVTVSYADLATSDVTASVSTDYSGVTFNNATIAVTPTANGFTFTVPDGLEPATAYTLSIPANAIGYATSNTYNAAQDIVLTTGVIADGVYYFKRNGTETYLTRGGNYGTEGVTDKFGISFLTTLQGDGTYTLKNVDHSLTANEDKYMNEQYTDQGIYYWTIESTTGGYLLKRQNGSYITTAEEGTYHYNYLTNAADAASAIIWTPMSKSEYAASQAARKATEITAIVSAKSLDNVATESDLAANFGWADYTSHITNAGLTDTSDKTGWTTINYNGARTYNELAFNTCAQIWNAVGGVYQTISNLPEGVYRVTVKSIYRIGSEAEAGRAGTEANSTAWIYATAGATTNYTQIKSWAEAGKPNSTDAIKNSANSDYVNTVYIVVEEGEELTIGLAQPTWCGTPWLPFCGWTLAKMEEKTFVTNLELDKNSASLTTGQSLTLVPTFTPADASDKTLTWTTSDNTIATISDAGVVTAINAGTATITATTNDGSNLTATCTVNVADAAAPSFFASEIVSGTDYFIMNAATGQFLGGGNNWGTRASLIEHGIPFGATKVSDGVYTLDSYTYNNATSHFLGIAETDKAYVDAGSTNLTITALGNGKYSINIPDLGYLKATSGSTIVSTVQNADNTLAQWYFLSKNDRDKMLAAATAGSPADATYYVKQANISRNRSAGGYNVNAWSQYNVGGTQDNANFAAQVYNAAVDNYQTIENIPNGTYTVAVQAFTSGSNVKFYANDQEVDVKANDSGVGSCSGAAALFKQGLYPNTVTVTVTDRTLKIGFAGDCSGNKWLCYDDVTLYMTGYTANTGVSAEDVELQIGQTAEIVAATVPATASFNALTYASSDANIATVDENGVVTGVAEGNTTITVTANEMENFSKTINVTVTLVTPTALALSESEVALNAETPSATLTVTPTPEGANDVVTWTSSDETVATVANGVVTAVSSGTATITATSTVAPEVSASATVTVTFPESTAPKTYFVNDGATRTVYTLGENLIKNGTFSYPNAVATWKTVGYTTDAVVSNFTITAEGGAVDNGAFITTNGGGVGSEKTIRKSVQVEVGKKYYFSVYTSGKAPSSDNLKFNALFKMSDATTETGTIKEFVWPQGAGKTATEWSKTECVFTAEAPYVGVRMGWNESSNFDEFVLAEITDEATVGNVQYALDVIPTANIGTGAFQYSQDAIDAANALVQGTATVEDVTNAHNALTMLNAPEDGKLYNIVNITEGFAHKGKALTFKSASDADLSGNTTSMAWEAEPGYYMPQGVKFTAVEGVKNGYKLSYTRADGNVVYISTGTLSGLGSNHNQIRPTTDASKALTFEVTSVGDNHWYLKNTETGNNVGSNGDTGFYTAGGSNKDMKIQEAVNNEVSVNIKAENQYGTIILPFEADVPEGVTAYSVSETSGATLTLVEVETGKFAANTPYIIFAEEGATATLAGLGSAYNDATFTEGLLTGVYTQTDAPNGSYVLQNNNDKVGFYRVNTENATPKVGANRAYLTKPAESGNVKAFFFGGDVATAIQSVFDGLQNGNAYDLAGRKVHKLQKGGIYVVNGKKVAVK